ncbi:hypothetical protein OG599_32425 [Streptomyces sp. NBC_01335]|uniref:FUSC family protein n=1 Tax=Streptomyces sp. NBC_01335 TaxID=2903828 RepID=UPI002E10F7F9|nr:hypothetical protein OG599_32425 [Streptomyces sp. NBC_01335]
MADDRTTAGARGWSTRLAGWWGRAAHEDSSERHTLLLIGKSTLAATLSWLVSYNLMDATSPAFAPFSAVTIMYVTVYQSVVQSLRYVAAVAVGVAVQALLGFLAGPDLLTFVLVAVIALSISRLRVLGTQGPQVATAALFAFSTYVSTTDDSARVSRLGQIVLLVLIGCAIGTAVNVAIAPPLRYRSAEHAVRVLARTLHDLTSDMHPALRDRTLDADTTSRWRDRAARTGSLIEQARAGLDTAVESVRYNPRRLLRRHRGHLTFQAWTPGSGMALGAGQGTASRSGPAPRNGVERLWTLKSRLDHVQRCDSTTVSETVRCCELQQPGALRLDSTPSSLSVGSKCRRPPVPRPSRPE